MYVLKCFISWLPRKIASLPFDIVGLFIVPILYLYREKKYDEVPTVLRPWTSLEDWTHGFRRHPAWQGCIPEDLLFDYKGFWGFWRYHALRNASAGLKSWRWFTHRLDDGQPIKYVTNFNEVDRRGYPAPIENWFLQDAVRDLAGKTYFYRAWHGDAKCFKVIHYFNGRRYVEFKIGWRIAPLDAHASNNLKDQSFRWVHGTTTTLSLRFGKTQP